MTVDKYNSDKENNVNRQFAQKIKISAKTVWDQFIETINVEINKLKRFVYLLNTNMLAETARTEQMHIFGSP